MNLRILTQTQQQIRYLGRPVRIFLIVNVIEGIILSIWILFFNFYILGLGFDRQFLGLVNSVTALATLILGIPIGILSDRIGRQRALFLGVGIHLLGATLELWTIHPTLLLCMAFLNGTGRMLFLLNVAPFLAGASKAETRTFLFSLNFGLVILAGVMGNLLAGYLADWFTVMLQVPATSVATYRSTLLLAVSLSCLSLILLTFVREPKPENFANQLPAKSAIQSGGNLASALKGALANPMIRQLALVQLVFGLGVALLTPYINLYFDEKFQVGPQTLGRIFSLKALFTGLVALLIPRLVQKSGSRIKIAVFFQFMGGVSWLLLGFTPGFSAAVCGFLLGGIFLNTPIPLVEAFSMEQVRESQRATLVSIRELSWQTSWGIGPYLSGSLQEHSGFSPIFVLSVAAIWLASLLNNIFFGKIEQ
ncbi:MAG: MFS transporter [Chloroflexota bacterium]